MSAFVQLQHLLPQHLISRVTGALASSENLLVKGPLIRAFAGAYGVDMQQAENPDLGSYASFNDFFSRPLKSGVRPIDARPGTVVSPADGAVSQAGIVREGKLIQAKGVGYSLEALAGDCARPEYEGGPFMTVYLSPKDYHRVHLPVAGRLVKTCAIPGKLFSVNTQTEGEVEGLFAINERLAMEFETRHGPMLVVMVGALIVASIRTVWNGSRSPYRKRQVHTFDLPFRKGDEIGHFLLGSSVVMAFEQGRVELDPSLVAGSELRMGQAMGLAAK